jgi:DNA-binding GntR family transcriptional regulator
MKREIDFLGNIEVPKSLREMAFQTLKEAILSNRLKPGVLYSEPILAERMGISRTPIREALLDLASRGFIRYVRNKGFRVNELEEKKIQDLFHYRRILEIAILKDITPKIKGETLEHIEPLVNLYAATREPFRHLELDKKFHLYLASLTENQFIINSLDNLKDMTDWVRSKTLLVKNRMERSIQEHAGILKMLNKRDAQGAAKAMEKHLRLAEESLLALLQSRKEKGRPQERSKLLFEEGLAIAPDLAGHEEKLDWGKMRTCLVG